MAIHFFWIIGMLFVAVILAAFVIGVVAIASRRPARQIPAAKGGESALDVLAQRFAKGEITAEEYQKARDLLKQ